MGDGGEYKNRAVRKGKGRSFFRLDLGGEERKNPG